MTLPNCPRCKQSQYVRHSLGHRRFDALLSLIGLQPFRCDDCRVRFYRFYKRRALPAAELATKGMNG